jgi:hypothetical protein
MRVLGFAPKIRTSGCRFTYNIHRNVAVEAEGNHFPAGTYQGERRILEGLFGVKVGVRRSKFGIFAKARPGLLRIKDRLFCAIPEGCPSAPSPAFTKSTARAIDLGVVVEFYPSRRVLIRTDVGDTIIRFPQGAQLFPTPRRLYYTSHNMQVSTGVAFRF